MKKISALGFIFALCLLSLGLFTAIAQQEKETTTVQTPGKKLVVSRGSVPDDFSKGGLFVLRFEKEPSTEDLSNLKKQGITLRQYLGEFSYYASVETGSAFKELPDDLTAIRPKGKHKIDRTLVKKVQGKKPTDRINVSALLFDDVTIQQAKKLFRETGATTQQKEIRYGGIIEANIAVAELENLAGSALVHVLSPATPPKSVDNDVAARRSNIDLVWNEYGLSGNNVTVSIIDSGAVYIAHNDFEDRVVLGEESDIEDHSTHVMGTILSGGVNSARAKGMAYRARGYSYDFTGDEIAKMLAAQSNYGVVSVNNSWGYSMGWEYDSSLNRWEWYGDYFFGRYNSNSASLDQAIYNNDIIVVFSMGNDRSDLGPSDGHYWIYEGNDNYTEVVDDPNPPKRDGPFLCLDLYPTAKNVIAAGATDSLDHMASFSSWGPTRDGRVKPDLVAKGVSTLSTNQTGGYAIKSGTSMSAPVITGATVLTVEHFRNRYGRTPSAAEVKGVLLATAKDLGNRGPDYTFGFGLLDMQRAVELISADSTLNTIQKAIAVKIPGETDNSNYFSFSLPSGVSKVKVLLVWTDPPGPVVDNDNSKIVNNLDLSLHRITKAGKLYKVKTYYPWVLDGSQPEIPATKGVNIVDNVELVEMDSPIAGEWIIEVKTGTFGRGSSQDFVLIVNSYSPMSGALKAIEQPHALKTNTTKDKKADAKKVRIDRKKKDKKK